MTENKDMRIWTILFVVLGVSEQLANGLLKTSFSLYDLLAVYGMVAAYYGYTFHMASKWGPPGQPTVRNQGQPSIGPGSGPVNTSGRQVR